MNTVNKTLLEALIKLQHQIHVHHKMNVKKDFSLMVADAIASKAIHTSKQQEVNEQ